MIKIKTIMRFQSIGCFNKKNQNSPTAPLTAVPTPFRMPPTRSVKIFGVTESFFQKFDWKNDGEDIPPPIAPVAGCAPDPPLTKFRAPVTDGRAEVAKLNGPVKAPKAPEAPPKVAVAALKGAVTAPKVEPVDPAPEVRPPKKAARPSTWENYCFCLKKTTAF